MATTTIVASPATTPAVDLMRSTMGILDDAECDESSAEAHAVYMASRAIDSARAWRRRVEEFHATLREMLPPMIASIAGATDAENAFHSAEEDWIGTINDIKRAARRVGAHPSRMDEICEAGLDALRAAYDARKGNAPA